MMHSRQDQGAEPGRELPGFDAGAPNPARMWNYWVAEAMPSIPVIARATRRFLTETVRQLATAGIRQFLDIGTGLPVADSTHEAAHQAAPGSRVVYVDNDPVVISHARALLAAGRRRRGTDYLHADLRDTDTMLAGAAQTLDFSRPVGVLLAAILHFIPDADDSWALSARLMDAVAPGSYLVIEHAASDIGAEAVATMADGYNEHARCRSRRDHASR
jgi:hypothetical protein